jgi:hypothetical protein
MHTLSGNSDKAIVQRVLKLRKRLGIDNTLSLTDSKNTGSLQSRDSGAFPNGNDRRDCSAWDKK